MNLQGAAARFREIEANCEAGLARDCAKAGAKEYLAALHVTTPVLSGALRASEHILSVSGSGAAAVAVVGPDGSVIYDRFRNNGGTITVKRARVLGTPAVGFFGKSVTQAGSRYMERAADDVEGTLPSAMRGILDDYLKF
jgi:hypothetical protein